jgi:hypothetical protein
MSFREKVKAAIKEKLEKSNASPIVILGPLSPEEEGEEIAKWIKNGKCPRCGHPFGEKVDGRFICKKDGLVLTDELIKKYS